MRFSNFTSCKQWKVYGQEQVLTSITFTDTLAICLPNSNGELVISDQNGGSTINDNYIIHYQSICQE